MNIRTRDICTTLQNAFWRKSHTRSYTIKKSGIDFILATSTEDIIVTNREFLFTLLTSFWGVFAPFPMIFEIAVCCGDDATASGGLGGNGVSIVAYIVSIHSCGHTASTSITG